MCIYTFVIVNKLVNAHGRNVFINKQKLQMIAEIIFHEVQVFRGTNKVAFCGSSASKLPWPNGRCNAEATVVQLLNS